MSLRYSIGRKLHFLEACLLAHKWFPLARTFARGRWWAYDICRIAGTRDIRSCLDVGAHVGDVAILLNQFFPDARIHCLEPTTATHAHLKDRLRKHDNIVCHRIALADFEGEISIKVEPLSVLNSLSDQIDTAKSGENVDRVIVTTLEKFAREKDIQQLDVLKIDAQGYDLAVLRGAGSLLQSGWAAFVLVEASILAGDKTNQPLEPINAFLAGLGFAAGGIYDAVYHGPNSCYLGCFNILYFHPGALDARFPGWRKGHA